MDNAQAMALLGIDGPDSTSTKDEVQREINRLEAFEQAPQIKARLAQLRRLLLTATNKGGFLHKLNSQSEDVLSQETCAKVVPIFREVLAGQDLTAQSVIDTIRAVVMRFKDGMVVTREGMEHMLPYLKLYLQDVNAGNLSNPVVYGDVSGADSNLEPDRRDARPDDGLGPQGRPDSGAQSMKHLHEQPKHSDPAPLSPEQRKALSETPSKRFKELAMEAKRLREEEARLKVSPRSDRVH